jgi:hypothetical protein
MASFAPTVSRCTIFAGGGGPFCQVGSWKTRSVLGRYNIVCKADITEAVTKIVEGRKQSAA